MVALSVLFTLMLFVLEPLGIDRAFRAFALRDKDRAFSLATRLHAAALAIAAITIAAAVWSVSGG